jgi:hypothetical protein
MVLELVILVFDCKLIGFFESEVACWFVSPSEYVLSCVYVNFLWLRVCQKLSQFS